MTETGADRRKEHRSLANGSVHITIENGIDSTFEGKLLDVSAGGFRMAHSQPALERGADVLFRHPMAHGKARVVWNRLLEGKSETGFLVLEG